MICVISGDIRNRSQRFTFGSCYLYIMGSEKKKNKDSDEKDVKKKGDHKHADRNDLPEEEENPHGGIPSRDLRKNLGCGG